MNQRPGAIERLRFAVRTLPGVLVKFSEAESGQRPSPERWTRKEVVGHLIDLASNNHQRFVRGQVASGQDRHRIHFRSAGWLVVSTLLGIPLGLWLLTAVPESVVKAILAVVIIGFSSRCLVSRNPYQLKDDRWAWAFGFGAGVPGTGSGDLFPFRSKWVARPESAKGVGADPGVKRTARGTGLLERDGKAMNSDNLEEELVGLLAKRQGHFRLESGHHGDLWLDLDSLVLRPARLRRFAGALALRLSALSIEAVCGPLVGGAFLAQAVAAELDVESYHTERVVTTAGGGLYSVNYRLPDTLRRHISGKNVALVDDAINAGSAARATCLELQASGARVAAVGALLVLGSRAKQLADGWNVPLEGIAHLPSELWSPEACPLCAARMPLEDGAAVLA